MAPLAESLKTALDFERQGYQFYVDAASRVEDPVVKTVLMSLADDERDHENIISRYYDALVKHSDWPAPQSDTLFRSTPEQVEAMVRQTVGSIGADASFVGVYETARDLEMGSVKFYSAQAESAEDERVVQFFRFLTRIETAHMQALQTVLDATGGGSGTSC